ncbi:glycosyltransferase [Nostoc sp. PCC 7107]|uniref:glycosyltransferase n=1 Tax=Nostoc sp. PCC 7107 TaxID=317936 RepID=UPI00029EF704|nr:glycosyltransferase [Nostoc sp. PCC 7107]AFY43910.1 glycosyl transferase group 1 [Nostoc sp. PCC 7107]
MNTKPKILYPIINGQVTGGNIVCLNIIDEALRRGWDVLVNSPTEGSFCEMLRQRGVSIYHLNTSRSFHWDAAINMAKLARKQEVDLIHVHAPFAGSILACIAGKLAGIPVIIHAHLRDPLSNNGFVRSYQKALNWLTSRFCCAAIIAVSEQVKQELIAEGFDERKFHVVYNGTPLHTELKITPEIARQNLNIPCHVPVVVHVGRLCKSKGQHILLQAAGSLRDRTQKIIYLIIGEDLEQNGAYRQYLEDMAFDLKINDFVWFLGQRFDIPQLLAAADLLVLPSDAEGLPLVILEAMAAGKPVVATNVGGVQEIVSHQETGLLVPVGNVQLLSEAIDSLIQNPESACTMGCKGLELVQSKFSLEKMQQEIFRIYEMI